jgi:hypothetical protein
MLSRLRPAAPLLVSLVLLAGLVAGCGGGGEQSGGGGSQEGGGEQQGESRKQARETKIAIGRIVSVNPDRRRMSVQPSQQVEGGERLSFKVRKNAQIALGEKEAEVGDISKGQQAQVEYVVKNEVNRAVSVQLFEAGGGQQPSGEDGNSN